MNKLRLIVLLMCYLSITKVTFCENWQWLKQNECDNKHNSMIDFVLDGDSVYAIAEVSNYIIINGDTTMRNLGGYPGTVLFKCSKHSGEITSYKFYEGVYFEHIKSDNDNGFILAGNCGYIEYFDNISINYPNISYYQPLIAKVNKDGAAKWVIVENEGFSIHSVNVDNEGNTILAGAFGDNLVIDGEGVVCGGGSYTDVFVAKIKKNSELDWVKTGGGPHDDFYLGSAHVATDNDLNIYLATSTMGDAVFNGINLGIENTLNEEINLIKLDKFGAVQWNRSMGGADTDYPKDIIVTPDNKIYITGKVGKKCTFGDKTINNDTDKGINSVFVSCWDVSGKHIQTNSFGHSSYSVSGLKIGLCQNKNIIVGGFFRGKITTASGILYSSGGSANGSMYIAEMNPELELLKAYTIGGASDFDALCVDKLGYIYVSGRLNGTVKIGENSCSANYFGKLSLNDFLINGKVFLDINNNCEYDGQDQNVNNNYYVQVMPLNELIFTDSNGEFDVFLPEGTYNLSLPKSNGHLSTCNINSSVSLSSSDSCGYVLFPIADEKTTIDKVYNNVSVYPNPFNDELTFTMNNLVPVTVDIYDLNGSLKLSTIITGEKKFTVCTKNLDAGIFFVHFICNNGVVFQRKIIKNSF